MKDDPTSFLSAQTDDDKEGYRFGLFLLPAVIKFQIILNSHLLLLSNKTWNFKNCQLVLFELPINNISVKN